MTDSSELIIQGSIISTAMMIAFFSILLVRRWQMERREEANRSMLGAITRSYIKRVGGFADEDYSKSWPDDLKLSAVSHLHLLLRGGERERLMQMAELDGLLSATIKKTSSLRASRRIDAIRLLQQFGSEVCIARLRWMLANDRNPTVRLEAAFALASIETLPPPRELIRILGMFDRRPNRLDSALLRVTAKIYTEQTVMLLDNTITDPQHAMIIEALGWSEDLSVISIIERATQSESSEIRSAALRAATKLGHPAVVGWVLPMLDDPSPFVRIQAVNCCAAIGLKEAVPKLETLLSDGDVWVEVRARQALDVLVENWPRDDVYGVMA